LPGSLCFSVNIQPHTVISFTALEISVLVSRFFEKQGVETKLKWPNDLWTSESIKCGGILVQGSQNIFCAGIGLNISSDDTEFGGIFSMKKKFNKKQLAYEISNYILNNRYDDTVELKNAWLKRCGHMRQMVILQEDKDASQGIFEGIGDYGEALIFSDGHTKRFFNGSLRMLH
jgi:biotin-(acetyl-CoA carboxylase) ligase